MRTIEQALHEAVLLLSQSPTARLDAEILLGHVLAKPSSYLFTWPDKMLEQQSYRDFNALITRRAQGEPIAYIVGYRDFWTLRLKVSPATLIPRPDTELLVELALEKLSKTNLDSDVRVLDLGTGTGAIALSLAFEHKNIRVLGVDLHHEAISLAAENSQSLAIENATFVQSNWFDAVQNQIFSLIVSNPPYIDSQDPHLQRGDVRFEPNSALISDLNGLADIQHICQQSVQHLVPGGALLIEHGFEQGQAVRTFFQAAGFVDVITKQDYSGLDRVTLGSMPTK